MSVFEFDVAEQANMLDAVEQFQTKFRQTACGDASPAKFRRDVNAFEICDIRSFGNDVGFENELFAFKNNERAVFFDSA